ncbi:MAG: hypothetical protein JW715_05195 [Sedimentisphaerales bacterium]|nr:hypothetical protein [Sedimentisphaerales bacterium]
MKTIMKHSKRNSAYALVLAMVAALVLTLLGAGLLHICYGVRIRAAQIKRQTISMLAAEAGYETGIFWMSRQPDVLSGLADSDSGSSGTLVFENSRCNYEVQFYDFIGMRPVFRIVSTGYSGSASRVVDVLVVQKIGGWDMGACRIPYSESSTSPVYFTDTEVVDIKVHINDLRDSPDGRDIYTLGTPQFLQEVEMGESRYAGSTDKYGAIMGYFEGGISFDQPDVKITDEVAVQSKVDRFRASTKPSFVFTPVGTAAVPNPNSAVQLEFFVDSGTGMVRATNNCTVQGYQRAISWDYRIVPGSGGENFMKYDIYAYHYRPDVQVPLTFAIEDTYVTQTFADKESEPGGQIFVDGNIVIGSADYENMVVKGKLTIVATGNIWIADSVVVDGPHHGLTGLPHKNNQNVLGLIAQGVIKVIDPGISSYPVGGINNYPGPAQPSVPDMLVEGTHSYVPVGNGTGTDRYLPDPTVVEAALTVGGGGWGAENVMRGSHGGRKEASGVQDELILVGAISESVRGAVGLFGLDGYAKYYTVDNRLLEGVLPGNIWFGGKYVPAPAGWHDYRLENSPD